MAQESENQLVGRCPICGDPEASTGESDAYSTSLVIADSDKDQYLVWSNYYQQYVCSLCQRTGRDFDRDEVRDQVDIDASERRQHMGFKRTYTTN